MLYNPLVLDISSYPTAELNRKKDSIRSRGKKLLDFGQGDPIEATPEFIREALIKSVPVISQYPRVLGIPELREAIANYIQRRFSVAVDANTEVLPCTGAKEAMYSISFLLRTTKRDYVIGPDPAYFVMERGIHVAGGKYYGLALNHTNNYLMELGEVPEEILDSTSIAWINYPNNPTGKTCCLDYLKRQLEVCQKHDILLCADECYTDLYYTPQPPPSILQLSKTGVLAFHSCSKRSGMTAYRSGFMAGDSDVLRHFAAFRDTLGVATPVYTQHAAIAAWQDDRHVEDRRRIFAGKRALFLKFFEKHAYSYCEPEGGIFVWAKHPRFSGRELYERLANHGIVIMPGDLLSKTSTDFFRLALVPTLKDCEEALSIWEMALA